MALGYDPKTSSVTVEYLGNKANNTFYWLSQFPWTAPYASQTITELSPKGGIVYEDGTTPTEPVK